MFLGCRVVQHSDGDLVRRSPGVNVIRLLFFVVVAVDAKN